MGGEDFIGISSCNFSDFPTKLNFWKELGGYLRGSERPKGTKEKLKRPEIAFRTPRFLVFSSQAPKCDFKLDRHSTIYIAMFFTDIALFYLIPLVLSVGLYGLIAKMLLYTAPRTLTSQDNNRSNQARLQVSSSLFQPPNQLCPGCEDADHSCDNLCHTLAALARAHGLQHPGRPLQQGEHLHGPLVPDVR